MIHTPVSVVRLPLVWALGVLLLLTTRPGLALTSASYSWRKL